jgi:ABC-2 type transport system permease protein
MFKLFAAIRKELIILFRDLPGLAVIFIMPVILIFIVTIAQENAIKISSEKKTKILFVNNSGSELSKAIYESLISSGFFQVTGEYDNHLLDESALYRLISKGDYQFGIVIPQHDSVIQMVLDPTLPENYRNSVFGSISFIIKGTQYRIAIVNTIRIMAPAMEPGISQMVSHVIKQTAPIRESFAIRDNATIKPSIIQNNVPGFILFAMFFIVVPLAGNIITEKQEGSFARIKTLPAGYGTFLFAKVLLYLVVCMLQFVTMMATGIWVFPAIMHITGLEVGPQYLGILLSTVASALAAIGFGVLAGTILRTQNQAASFGSVMVVILGILSGTFLPVYLMPKAVQYFSMISPIRWGIDNYLELFIRNGHILTIIPNILLLLLFFSFAMIISIAIFAKKK